MKEIEEFSVNGKYEEEPINGKARVYTSNLRKAKKKGSKNSILTSKIGAVVIVASLAISAIAGYDAMPKTNGQQIEYSVANHENFDVRLHYKVKKGDTLWKIVSKFTVDEKVKDKVQETAILNNLTDVNNISEGMTLKIDVPIQETQLFPDEYYEFIWGAKVRFLKNAFDIPPERVHPENKYFWSVKEEVETIIAEANLAKGDLDKMIEQREIYGDVRIREMQMTIDLMYEQAINITDLATGVNYYNTNAIEEYNLERLETEAKAKTL